MDEDRPLRRQEWASVRSRLTTLRQQHERTCASDQVPVVESQVAFIDRVLRELTDPNALLCRAFFGGRTSSIERDTATVVCESDGRRVAVSIDAPDEEFPARKMSDSEVILVTTDLGTFRLAYFAAPGGHELLEDLSADAFVDQLALAGSLWSLAFPTYPGVLSRTVSFAVSEAATEGFFSARRRGPRSPRSEEEAARGNLSHLCDELSYLTSLHELHETFEGAERRPRQLDARTEGLHQARYYDPARSSIFDWGHPASAMTRGDPVITYVDGGLEYHRDFLLNVPAFGEAWGDLRLATFDLLHMLAIRRSKVFRLSFAKRVYNVLLPPAVLTVERGDPQSGLVLFPYLSLYRIPRAGSFRRTLSLSILACPVSIHRCADQVEIVARSASLEEYELLRAELSASVQGFGAEPKGRRFLCEGPLQQVVDLPTPFTVPEFLKLTAETLLARAIGRRVRGRTETIVSQAFFPANLESRVTTLALLVPWESPTTPRQPWHGWPKEGNSALRAMLFKTIYRSDYLRPSRADAFLESIDLEAMSVGNTLGADMAGMTLYDPLLRHKTVIYPKKYERYPNHSLLRWMSWQVYIDSALTALRALLDKFHPVLERRGDLAMMISAGDDMMLQFAELYDLDIRDYAYREEYERLRLLMDIDLDYAGLKARFESGREDESLRAQQRVNQSIFTLTLVTIGIAVASTAATLSDWTLRTYLVNLTVVGVAFALLAATVGRRVLGWLARVRGRFGASYQGSVE